MLQNEGALLIVRENFHHGWRNFWFFLLWNAPEWRISVDYGILFTMVEENFDFYCSTMLQNEGFILILRESFHHVWRKFSFLLITRSTWSKRKSQSNENFSINHGTDWRPVEEVWRCFLEINESNLINRQNDNGLEKSEKRVRLRRNLEKGFIKRSVKSVLKSYRGRASECTL